ncbi:MAG: ABC transporter permease [Clostridiales bacterium]|nr:ABC transporter permease [Clostridiales bacterium]
MLSICVKMEQKKLKHSHLWLVFAIIPVIPALMGAGNYLNNLGLLKSEWYSLWTQQSLFYSNFFYGPLIALYCACIWRVEHLNHNWNSLMTMPVPVRDVFLAKLMLAFVCTVGLQLWVWILFVISGKAVGLTGMPPAQILLWLLRGSAGGLAIAALQLVLSMLIRSFAVPIALSLLGSILGLLAGNAGYGLLFPYSLMMLGMNANRSENMVDNLLGFGISVAVFVGMFTAVGILWLRKRDVTAG